jgi:signal transduction histidine kinase
LTRADGRVMGVLGVSADITAMRKLEEQYRQAQKMEAVGQLAGGVAHDFNNILQIITGYTEVAQLRVSAGRHPTGELEEIGRAAARASDLVRQLLALSRQQSIRRQSLNLNGLITGLGAMLRRLIEERVELRTTCRGPLPAVYADPAQIEQVVVNLSVNARDAMPQGGVLHLETRGEDLTPESCLRLSGVRPGRFVVLVVSDTGTGIPPENVDRVFEPFFTTKLTHNALASIASRVFSCCTMTSPQE